MTNPLIGNRIAFEWADIYDEAASALENCSDMYDGPAAHLRELANEIRDLASTAPIRIKGL